MTTKTTTRKKANAPKASTPAEVIQMPNRDVISASDLKVAQLLFELASRHQKRAVKYVRGLQQRVEAGARIEDDLRYKRLVTLSILRDLREEIDAAIAHIEGGKTSWAEGVHLG